MIELTELSIGDTIQLGSRALRVIGIIDTPIRSCAPSGRLPSGQAFPTRSALHWSMCWSSFCRAGPLTRLSELPSSRSSLSPTRGMSSKRPSPSLQRTSGFWRWRSGSKNGLIKPERRPKSCGSWCSRSSRSANMTRRPRRCIRRPSPSARLSRTRRESFADFAQSKGHAISLAVAPGLSYCGDEAAVRQLVSILLDNAVKYAAPETEIRISLEQIKRGVKLTVTNTCDQPPEGDLNRLFDRFYRPDASRTAATGGFGIGLSIAKSIAEAHRGQIRASTQGTAISFIAELK